MENVTSLSKVHVLRFVSVQVEAYATYCLFQTMQQGFGLGRCIYQKCYVISKVHVRNSLCPVITMIIPWVIPTNIFSFTLIYHKYVLWLPHCLNFSDALLPLFHKFFGLVQRIDYYGNFFRALFRVGLEQNQPRFELGSLTLNSAKIIVVLLSCICRHT